MKGAFQIARIFGIPVQVHWTFSLIFVWVFYQGHSQSWDGYSLLWTTLFILALFTCVVFHEFGHALTARYFGVETRDIILSPIGGVARLDRLPEQPHQEFLVAAAGPLVNIAIAAALLPYLFFDPERWRQLGHLIAPDGNVFFIDLSPLDYFFMGLFLLNGTLAVFNLLPAFPMDGGRILRALLSMRLGRSLATRIAAYIGQALAVALVAYGIWQLSIVTAFIGLFVFYTAASETRMVRYDLLLEKHRVGEIIRRTFTPIYRSDPMERPIEELTHGLERNFLVFDEWQTLVGILGEENLLRAVRNKHFGQPVSGYLHAGYEALLPGDSLKDAVGRMQKGKYEILPVFENDNLIGVLDMPAINSFLRMQEKMSKEKRG